MRPAAAILYLICAITCGYFWATSYSKEYDLHYTVFGRSVTLASFCGRHAMAVSKSSTRWSDFSHSMKSVSLDQESHESIERVYSMWKILWEQTYAGWLVPAWFTTGVCLLLATLSAFWSPIRRLFRRKATAPLTPPAQNRIELTGGNGGN